MDGMWSERWGAKIVLMASVLVLLPPCKVWGRPVDLSPPANGLGSATSEGYVGIWSDLGSVDFSNGLQLPLRLDFCSDRETPSLYVGWGWRCVLLEATALQRREDLIRATLICGKYLDLYRDKQRPGIFKTRDLQWQAELKGDRIRVFRDDGWELTYLNGHIQRLKTDTGRVLEWITEGALVKEIRGEMSSGHLEVKKASVGSLAQGLIVNGKEYAFTYAPCSEEYGAALTLKKVTFPDGLCGEMTTDTGKRECVMEFKPSNGKECHYSWDFKTRHIVSDSEWTYTIGERKSRYELPPLSRRNAQGQTESYFYDALKSITTFQAADGTITRKYYFTGRGPNHMKLRKEEQVKNGQTVVTYRAAYDEDGNLIREIQATGEIVNYPNDTSKKGSRSSILVARKPEPSKPLLEDEAMRLKQIAAEIRPSQRNNLLVQLATFYTRDMNSPERARALIKDITNPKLRFYVASMVVLNDNYLSATDRIKKYRALIEKYPDEKPHIEQTITSLRQIAHE